MSPAVKGARTATTFRVQTVLCCDVLLYLLYWIAIVCCRLVRSSHQITSRTANCPAVSKDQLGGKLSVQQNASPDDLYNSHPRTLSPTIWFTKVDFPAFGSPAIATCRILWSLGADKRSLVSMDFVLELMKMYVLRQLYWLPEFATASDPILPRLSEQTALVKHGWNHEAAGNT